jgi:hypothetical protein
LRIDRVSGQQCKQRFLSLRCKVLLRQRGHGFVTSATPGFSRWRGREI